MSNLSSSSFKGLKYLRNSFWREVLSTWLNNKQNIDIPSTVLKEAPLFNNINVKFHGNVLFFPELVSRNILLISDVFIDNVFISFELFKQKVNIPGAFLIYKCLFCALRPIFTKLTNNSSDSREENTTRLLKFQDMEIGSIGRKGFYQLLNPPESPLSEIYWSRRLGFQFPKHFWSLSFNSTKDSRLQTLQWKILMNIYPTAIILSKMNITSTDRCELCNIRETIDHFFFHCPKREKLWKLVESHISFIFSRQFQITWSKALLGVAADEGFKKDGIKLINYIILLAKQAISKSVYGSHQDPCIILENELRARKIIS